MYRDDELETVKRAYDVAKEHHKNQLRQSGEPYIIHPIAVASILADLGMDSQSVAAALLHDTVEDTDVTKADIEREFGDEIAQLVDGVTSSLKCRPRQRRRRRRKISARCSSRCRMISELLL